MAVQKWVTQQHRWLLLLGGLGALGGYWGPWVNHRAAGLVITGLDLAEYVKFLPPVRSGELTLWREGFYLPLVAVSLTFSLAAFRPEFGYRWPLRALLLLLALVAALNLLPPAWTPPLLVTPEFRLQTFTLVGLLGALSLSPFWALLPTRTVALLVSGLIVLALWFAVPNFLRVLPIIADLYQEPLHPGWGIYLMGAGLVLLAAASFTGLRPLPKGFNR